MLVYIDDMAVAGKSVTQVKQFKIDIGKHFDITDLGRIELLYILGIQVHCDSMVHTISLNQTVYIHQILMHFSM